jgi:hypothetical protein
MLSAMSPRSAVVFSLAILALAAVPAAADDPPDARWHYGIELDPLPFALGGYGGLVSVRPDRRWKIGLSSYGVDYPNAFVTGDDAGFHLHIKPSSVLMIDYSLTGDTPRGGWFVGGEVRQARIAYTHDDAPGMTTDVTHYELAVSGGYVWYPFEHTGLFLQAWGSVGHYVWSTGTPTVDGHTYHPAAIVPYATVHIGFEI